MHGAAAASARTINAKVLIFAGTTPYSSQLNPALVVAVEQRLRCWPGGYGDTKTTGCQFGLAGENLEQELCLIFSFHLLFCLVADEEDSEKMRVLIPAGAAQRTRYRTSLLVGAFCWVLLLQLAAAACLGCCCR